MTQARPNRAQRRRGAQPPPKQVELEYIKNTIAPVLHIDGAVGGVTPHGSVYLALFSEHAKTPDKAIIKVDAEGRPREAPRGRSEWVRDVAVEVTMSYEVAVAVRDLINGHVERIRQRLEEAEKSSDDDL